MSNSVYKNCIVRSFVGPKKRCTDTFTYGGFVTNTVSCSDVNNMYPSSYILGFDAYDKMMNYGITVFSLEEKNQNQIIFENNKAIINVGTRYERSYVSDGQDLVSATVHSYDHRVDITFTYVKNDYEHIQNCAYKFYYKNELVCTAFKKYHIQGHYDMHSKPWIIIYNEKNTNPCDHCHKKWYKKNLKKGIYSQVESFTNDRFGRHKPKYYDCDEGAQIILDNQ